MPISRPLPNHFPTITNTTPSIARWTIACAHTYTSPNCSGWNSIQWNSSSDTASVIYDSLVNLFEQSGSKSVAGSSVGGWRTDSRFLGDRRVSQILPRTQRKCLPTSFSRYQSSEHTCHITTQTKILTRYMVPMSPVSVSSELIRQSHTVAIAQEPFPNAQISISILVCCLHRNYSFHNGARR